MNDKALNVNRGGRPRFTTGKVSVRLPEQVLKRLQQEGHISDTIRDALERYFSMKP